VHPARGRGRAGAADRRRRGLLRARVARAARVAARPSHGPDDADRSGRHPGVSRTTGLGVAHVARGEGPTDDPFIAAPRTSRTMRAPPLADPAPQPRAAATSARHGVALTFETIEAFESRPAPVRMRPWEDTLLRVIDGVVRLTTDGEERRMGIGD